MTIVTAQSEQDLAYSRAFEIKAPPLEVLAFIECYIPEDQSFAAYVASLFLSPAGISTKLKAQHQGILE